MTSTTIPKPVPRQIQVPAHPKRERFALLCIMAVIALVYAITPLILNGVEPLAHPGHKAAFWAPDSGARLEMIRSWLDHGRPVHIYYRDAGLDPAGQIHPYAYFLFHQQHGFASMYSPLFPILSGIGYWALGFKGLTLFAAFCGLACVLATYKTACILRLRSRLLIAGALGLATPLLIYSSVFWDHSAIMLLVALTGYWLIRCVKDQSMAPAIVAGAVMGAGMWVHEQFLALFVAVWLCSLPMLPQSRRVVLGIPAGFVAVCLLWAASNFAIYGVPLGPHLGANVVQNNSDHPFSVKNILDVHAFMDRAAWQVLGTRVSTPQPELWNSFVGFTCLLVVFAGLSWEYRRQRDLALIHGLLIASGSLALWLVVKVFALGNNGYPPSGLFQVTPLLIPALGIPWYTRSRNPDMAETYYAWISRSSALFLLFLVINPMYPGTDWGSRYLLSALPLLVLLAASGLERAVTMSHGPVRNLGYAACAVLVGASLLSQIYGVVWVKRNTRWGQELNKDLLAIPTRVVVTDRDYMGPRSYTWPDSQKRFLVRNESDARLFFQAMNALGINELTYVGLPGGGNILDAEGRGDGWKQKGNARIFFYPTRQKQGDELQTIAFERHDSQRQRGGQAQ